MALAALVGYRFPRTAEGQTLGTGAAGNQSAHL